MPQVTRTAVFMQLKVVPIIAMATVTAMVIIRPNPIPPSILSPISFVRSPIGAPDAAAAAIPLTVAPETVPTSLSLIINPAAKYSNRYANRPWMIRERMIALGIVFSGSLVSAAKAVQLSNPTNMRIAKVD